MRVGYIKLHRQFKEWGWYRDTPTKSVFIHLLLTANYEAREYRGHKIPKGAGVYGRKALAVELDLSEQQIRTALKKLEDTGEINQRSTRKFTIISIVKWDEYQNSNQQITNEQPTDNQQVTTLKEDKNKKTIPPLSPQEGEAAEPPKNRGTRLPDDWTVSKENIDKATSLDMSAEEIIHAEITFKNHYSAISGPAGRKLDWNPIWENWCRELVRRRRESPPARSSQPDMAGVFAKLRRDAGCEGAHEPDVDPQSEFVEGPVIELEATQRRSTG
ncbi:hypothetical protein [Flexibacterium corallicola]|uniref:hypothetical protein n=1 Tax=Flexibacterium corallicola TaxID=3037259 RepID=UPI00286F5121|nr:hypothetical protein [Pseudovibrio sp. M1P-2-3]